MIWRCAACWVIWTQLGLPAELKELLRDLAEHWTTLRARQNVRCVLLRAIIGVGPITADAAVATVGKAREFNHGR